MYVPAAFGEKRPEVLHRLIEANSFGLLITGGTDGLFATHLPFLLARDEGENGTLVAHLARANPQARTLAAGAEALVVFGGPHGYVSPTWYAERGGVPTWNYAVVHAHGEAVVVDDAAHTRKHVEALAAKYERGRAAPWAPDYDTRRLSGIVGIDIRVARLEGKFKLSQNRSAADRAQVVAQLLATGRDEDAALARLMDAAAPPT